MQQSEGTGRFSVCAIGIHASATWKRTVSFFICVRIPRHFDNCKCNKCNM